MSLKMFHIVFITISTILSAGVGAWGVHTSRQTGDSTAFAIGIVSLVGGVILVGYSVWFVRKLKALRWW